MTLYDDAVTTEFAARLDTLTHGRSIELIRRPIIRNDYVTAGRRAEHGHRSTFVIDADDWSVIVGIYKALRRLGLTLVGARNVVIDLLIAGRCCGVLLPDGSIA